MQNTGVIGLGQIGGGVARCLARAGMLSAVYDVRPGADEGLDLGVAMAASPASLARQCEVVIVAVVTAAQTIDVLSGAQGLLAGAHPGLSVVLVVTVCLDDLARIRALTDAANVPLVDCGVAGGKLAAENGLICLVGAEPPVLEKVRPTLEGFARYVAHMGGPGAGMAAKLVRNAVFHGCLRAGYEGAMLARAAGLDLDLVAQVIDDSADGVGGPMLMMTMKGDPQSDPEVARARRSMAAVIAKDLDAALSLAQANGVALPLVRMARETLGEVVGLGAGAAI